MQSPRTLAHLVFLAATEPGGGGGGGGNRQPEALGRVSRVGRDPVTVPVAAAAASAELANGAHLPLQHLMRDAQPLAAGLTEQIGSLVRSLDRGDHARAVTDLDILAFRFPGAGHDVKRGRRHRPLGANIPDPALHCPADRADMIVGEVKEGPARFNPAMRDPAVIGIALARFGCCSADHRALAVLALIQKWNRED